MIKAEVSLYPAGQDDISSLSQLSTTFLEEHGLDQDFHLGNASLDTTFSGDPDDVWTALRHLFQENHRQDHDVVMITTLTYLDD